MKTGLDRRLNPRLGLSYPIEVQVREKGRYGGTSGVTSNLSARGAYFKTFCWDHFREGGAVHVTVTVPHPLHSQEWELIQLTMHAKGRVRRLDTVDGREALGEDGILLKGVALEFLEPLSFDYG